MTNKLSLTIALLTGLAFSSPIDLAFGESPKSPEPIKIAVHDWTGNFITTGIISSVLEKAGYKIEPVRAEYMGMWPGLESGDIDVAIEVWSSSAKALMEASMATGKTESLGETGLQGFDRWWYPSYVKEKCPGLPDWHALNDCASLFATPETEPKGRLLLFPSSWGGFDDERVKGLGLNYDIVRAGSEAALYAELRAAYERKAPILAWLYEPHWAPMRYKGEWVELPPYSDDCYAKDHGCQKPSGPIWKVVTAGVIGKWPDAYKIVKAFHIENAELNELIAKIDLENKTPKEVVDEWMSKNEDRWKSWIPTS